MDQKTRNQIIIEAKNNADIIRQKLYDIVWEKQEGQPDHFDKLSKTEQVVLIGLLNDATKLFNSLSYYQSWFIDKL